MITRSQEQQPEQTPSTTSPSTASSNSPKIFKPGKLQPSQGICIYGRSGVGKTTLLATMPGKGLVIDVPQIEGGTEVLVHVADRVDVTVVPRWEEIEAVYNMLVREKHGYKWVAIDSLTAMQRLARRKVVKEKPISADPHKMTLEEYGKVNSLVDELVYNFRLLPIFTVWVAQEKKFSNENESSMYGPDVQPGVLGALMPSMLMVGRMKIISNMDGSTDRHLVLTPREDTHAKSRAIPSVIVPPVIKNPNLSSVLLYLAGKEAQLEKVEEEGLFSMEVS